MKRKIVPLAQSLFALILLALIVWGVYFLGITFITGLSRLQSDIAVGIIAASATVIVSVISVVSAKQLENRANIRQELRTKKIPIYEEIISTLFKILFAEKLGKKKLSEVETMAFFVTSSEKLTIWGSDEVVLAFRACRTASLTGTRPEEFLFMYEKLLLAIRKDLGHKNRNFKRGTVLGLFINDIEKYL